MDALKPLGVFISHAATDRNLATLTKALLLEAVGSDIGIFCTSDWVQPSGKLDVKITEALRQVKVVVSLMTPHSVFRPWLTYEAGAANVIGPSSLVVVLAKGLSFDSLPEPIKPWHAFVLQQAEDVTRLCVNVASVLGTSLLRPVPDEWSRKVLAEAAAIPGDFRSVRPGLIANRSDESPFNLGNILQSNALQRPTKLILVAGQNLHTLASAKMRQAIFEWLAQGERDSEGWSVREFRLMLCDSEASPAIETWSSVVGGRFEQHLRDAEKCFTEWAQEANGSKLKLKFEAKRTYFVPVTAVFIDPDENGGYMALTPVVFDDMAEKRPHFIVHRRDNETAFAYYWDTYRKRYEDETRSFLLLSARRCGFWVWASRLWRLIRWNHGTK